jgi:hypothetical protein
LNNHVAVRHQAVFDVGVSSDNSSFRPKATCEQLNTDEYWKYSSVRFPQLSKRPRSGLVQ